MKKLFKWGRNAFALVPGLTLMFYNLWIPLEIPRLLLGGIMQAVGVFTLIIFHQKKINLKKKNSSQLRRQGIAFFMLFVLLLLCYILIYDNQNIYNSKYDTTILIPFWKNDELTYMINKAGSINSAILTYGPEAVRKSINDTELALSTTKILFMINYILIFEFLVIGFGFITINEGKKEHKSITGKQGVT